MTSLTMRLLNLPDRILALAMGEIISHLAAAHVFLDGKGTAMARAGIAIPARIGQRAIHAPWAEWVRQSDRNYGKLYDDLMGLVAEWKRRHGVEPKCAEKVRALKTRPRNLPMGEMTAMPKDPLPASYNFNPATLSKGD